MFSDEEKWHRASFRLVGDNLPIDEIEERLDLQADSICKKGEYVLGNPRLAKYKTNVWVSDSSAETNVPFEEQITKLLDILELKENELKTILALPSVEGEMFLSFSSGNGQGGTYFSQSLLTRIANCGLAIHLNLYPPDIDEEENH